MKIDTASANPIEHEQKEKLKGVSQAYEQLFVNQLVSEMRKSVSRGGLIPESHAEKVYQGLLDNQYSEQISHSEQLGLAEVIYGQLLRGSGLK